MLLYCFSANSITHQDNDIYWKVPCEFAAAFVWGYKSWKDHTLCEVGYTLDKSFASRIFCKYSCRVDLSTHRHIKSGRQSCSHIPIPPWGILHPFSIKCWCFSSSFPFAIPSFVHHLLIWQPASRFTLSFVLVIPISWWTALWRGEKRIPFDETGGRRLVFPLILQLNPSPCLCLSSTSPPIKPLHGACPSRWAGVVQVPGSSGASHKETGTIWLRWIGLAFV